MRCCFVVWCGNGVVMVRCSVVWCGAWWYAVVCVGWLWLTQWEEDEPERAVRQLRLGGVTAWTGEWRVEWDHICVAQSLMVNTRPGQERTHHDNIYKYINYHPTSCRPLLISSSRNSQWTFSVIILPLTEEKNADNFTNLADIDLQRCFVIESNEPVTVHSDGQKLN